MTGELLGYEVEDVVTGVKGIVTSENAWLNGCVRCGLETCDGDGKPVEYWIDKGRLKKIPGGRRIIPVSMRLAEETTAKVETGGTRPDPPSVAGPSAPMAPPRTSSTIDIAPRIA